MMSRILVIDDSTTLRKLVEIAMRGSGCDVDFAATGSDGISRARSVRPDVILLDFLLPDLPSIEVCQRLADDGTTARVPVVVMSANQPDVFADFQRFPAVVDFVGKPFSSAEIRNRLESAMRTTERAPAARARRSTMRPAIEAAPLLSEPQLAAATKRIVEALLPRFTELAALEPIADPVARYIDTLLGPETVTRIVAALTGVVPEAPRDVELELRGSLMTTPLLDVLRLLTTSAATGTLVIQIADTFRIHLRRGGVLMCTSSRYDDTWLGSVPSHTISRELAAQVRRLQESEGKPALISLAQAGAARVADLPAELHALGARLLADLLGATAGRFDWQPSMTLPDYVDAFGRHLSITSIALARQRQSRDVTQLPHEFLEEVYDRTPRFSDKLGGARLDVDEQRILGMINGRSSVRDIIGGAEISADRAAAIFARLRNVDLIRSEPTSTVDAGEGAVVVVDVDQDGFVAPLRAHLARRPRPIEVVSLAADQELIAAILKLRPRLVLVNASLTTAELVEHEIAPLGRAGTITLAAVLDHSDPAVVSAMLAAGVHAVLTKPIHVNDIERLLSL